MYIEETNGIGLNRKMVKKECKNGSAEYVQVLNGQFAEIHEISICL